ncbi:MAG TPA: hypothetical protein VEF53_11420 [Patescibacteria group bacterium]|nr:hypothetical protein [Patescibacteria group bacterium]
MKNKVKGGLSIFFMSITAYMMITTKYTHALGDYILEFIGLRPWTGDYSGTHLTILYFGILFIIGLFLVKKYAVEDLNMRRKSIFIIFVAFMILFSSITGMTVRNIKKDSSGLLAIGYNAGSGRMNYKAEDKKFVEFKAEFELTNYSNEKRTFYIIIDNPFYREDGVDEINFYTFDGKQAIFELEGKEKKSFLLSLDNYHVAGGREFQSGSGNGTIQKIVLMNDNGNKVRLESNNFFGIELGR